MSRAPYIIGTADANGRGPSARHLLWLAILANVVFLAALIATDRCLDVLVSEVAPDYHSDSPSIGSKVGLLFSALLPGIAALMSRLPHGAIARWGRGILCVLCGLGGAGAIAVLVLACSVTQWNGIRMWAVALSALSCTSFSGSSFLYYVYFRKRT